MTTIISNLLSIKTPVWRCFLVGMLVGITVCQGISADLNSLPIQMKRYAIGYTDAITSDLDGFTWFSTRDGIKRFDGQKFELLRDLAPNLILPEERIRHIHCDRHNRLWVCHSFGKLYRIDLNNYDIRHFSKFEPVNYSGFTYSFEESPNGDLYFPQLNKILHYSYKRDSIIEYKVGITDQDILITNIEQIEPDVLCFSSYQGVFLYNMKNGNLKKLAIPKSKSGRRNSVLLDSNGHLWVNNWYDKKYGLIKHDVWADTMMQVFSSNLSAPYHIGSTDIWKMSISDNQLWLACNGGFWKIDINKSHPESIHIKTEKSTYKRVDQLRSLHIDRNQNMWLGSNVNVYHTLNYTKDFKVLRPQDLNSNSLVMSPVQTAKHIGNNQIVVGTQYGISVYNSTDERFNNFHLPDYNGNQYNNTICSISDNGEQSFWVGTWSGLYLIEKGTNKILKYYITFNNAGIDHPKDVLFHEVGAILHVFEDNDNNVWVINNERFIRRLVNGEKRDSFVLYDGPEIEGEYFFQMINANIDDILVASRNGIWKYVKQLDSFQKILTHDQNIDDGRIRSLLSLHNNKTLVVTDQHIYYLIYEMGKYRVELLTYIPNQGTLSNPVLGKNNIVWLLAEQSIIKFDLETRTPLFFDSDVFFEGVGYNHVIGYQASTVDDSGKIFFAAEDGLIVFDPSKMRFNTNSPNLVITSIESNGEKVSELPSHKIANLTLESNQDNLQISFSVTNDQSPTESRYRYLLEGSNSQWIDISTQNSLALSGLSPGRYVLNLSATSSDGHEIESPIKLKFYLPPPIHRSSLAYALYVISISSLLYLVYRWQLNQRLKRELLRINISKNLHDEVGGILAGIALKSDIAQMKTEIDTTEIAGIAKMSRRALGKMSDVLWSIDARRDNSDDLIFKMKEHAAEMCGIAEIKYHFTVQGIKNRKMPTDQRQNIYLIFKEAVNNVVKHSKATQLDIVIENDSQFKMTIKDNGVGGVQQNKTGGQGLENLRSRAKDLNGNITLTFEDGCTVVLTCPKI